MDKAYSFTKKIQELATEQEQTPYEEAFEDIKEFLIAEEEIKFYVAGTNNYGHQASTINALYVILEILGDIEKTIRVIYDEDSEKSVWLKLVTLIPGLPKEFTENLALKKGNITILFNTYTKYSESQPITTSLCICGAFDEPVKKFEETNHTFIKQLFVDFFLVLQPFRWTELNAKHAYFDRNDKLIADLENSEYCGQEIVDRGYYIKRPQLTDEDWKYFENQDNRKAGCVRAIEEFCQPKTKVNTCPIYFSSGRNYARPQVILFNLINGILKAKESDDSFKRPTIIVMLGYLPNKFYQALQKIIQGQLCEVKCGVERFPTYVQLKYSLEALDPEDFPKLKQYLEKYSHQFAKISLQPIEEMNQEKIAQKLQSMTNEDILILPLGNLVISTSGIPRNVFNYIFSLSTLPCAFEGKGSASLVLNMGIPYFHLLSIDLMVKNEDIYKVQLYPTIPLGSPQSEIIPIRCHNSSVQLTTTLQKWEISLSNGEYLPSEYIGDFIADSCGSDKSNDYYTYFKELGNFYNDIKNDKLINALLNLRKVALDFLQEQIMVAEQIVKNITYKKNELEQVLNDFNFKLKIPVSKLENLTKRMQDLNHILDKLGFYSNQIDTNNLKLISTMDIIREWQKSKVLEQLEEEQKFFENISVISIEEIIKLDDIGTCES
ncbi:MAG: hypothetical protein KME08_12200 [Aphanothece sp. CMT-3BRIN-NPC111]|jgi:hypothetical protein|nr:hypothetical protein [Aphanothece sp. CMT-3BRIN-NPC111]